MNINSFVYKPTAVVFYSTSTNKNFDEKKIEDLKMDGLNPYNVESVVKLTNIQNLAL